MSTRTFLVMAVAALILPRDAAAQLDPLLFLKRTQPNVLLMVEATNRMQRDHNDDYRDNHVYPKSALAAEDQVLLGITAANTSTTYRRRYVGLTHITPNANNEKFEAERIEIVGDLEGTAYSLFDARTRINIAKASLVEAVNRNYAVARFALMKTRQSSPSFPSSGLPNEGPVKLDDALQQSPISGDSGGRWNITRPTVSGATNNGAISLSGALVCSSSGVACLVAADASGANSSVRTALGLATGASGSLIPVGRDSSTQTDTPIDLMLTDLKTEATRLANADDALSKTSSPYRQCRNTVAILVVGGGQGNTSSGDPSTIAADFKNIGANHRVPVYVIAVAPAAGSDMSELEAVASASGGKYTEITAEMVEATTAGEPVPEFVYAVNEAVQHGYASQADCDTDPTTALPYGPFTEHQVTSPIIGTVYLKDAYDIDGESLDDSLTTDFNETYITNGSQEIPQRSNVLITSGFSLPGFDGKMRAFRVYKPAKPDAQDSATSTGYKFVKDGTRLWVACAPGTPTTGTSSTRCSSLSTSARNIYTALPDGTMVAFTTANAGTLKDYLLPATRHPNADSADAEALISFIRSQPLGAFVGSTPALMDPPSLDPPPDTDYTAFKTANADRRAVVWVGGNDGMIHGIDARLGVEVWAFIPFNLLPKLHTLRSGQPVGDFRYFVDSSPKVADVKVNGAWRTYLVIGQGAGGTFYQTFDVTLEGMADVVAKTDDDAADVLAYFDSEASVPLVWSFPRYSMFDATRGCNATDSAKLCTGASPTLVYGELSDEASAAEKTVGETWSDPAVGQIETSSGPYTVLVGSGFYKLSMQTAYRGGTAAGTTFYVLDMETGEVLASRSVGNDGKAESGTAADSCEAANDCTKLKNALQADPVATGPSDSRFITKTYLGDLDGRLWRFDIQLGATNAVEIATPVKLYDAGENHPMFSSMATVNIGTTQQYLFQGTGSEFLPTKLPNGNTGIQYKLLVVLDGGTTGTKKAEILLTKTDNSGDDEKVTSFPAVAGDIVFFATTTFKPQTPCNELMGNLYAFTFIGGPAYDTNGDGALKTTGNSADKTKIAESTGRASAPFIVDQHLVFASGTNIEMFGDDEDFNNGVGQAGVRILSWREVR